ncbi:ABC transporter permease [Opitutaceae bacterium]|nr:ABC transporter permease [Opitutaceae bacterium]
MAPTNPTPESKFYRIWQTRGLLWQFSQRSIELRHRGSFLGAVWVVLQPLLMLGLYGTVFGYIFGGSFNVLPDETPIDYGLGIFLGLTLYQFVAETFAIAPSLIVGNPNFVKKVVFPLAILPISAVVTSGFHLLVSLMLIFVGVAFFGNGLTLGVIWLPLILLPLVLIALGITFIVSALGVFWRDIAQVIPFLSLLFMYTSAVFFPASMVPTAFWDYLKFNPLLLAIEMSRDAVLWQRPINLHHLSYEWLAGLSIFLFGAWVFGKLRSTFADVL